MALRPVVSRIDLGHAGEDDEEGRKRQLTEVSRVMSRESERESQAENPTRVFILDDHELVRNGLRSVIDAAEDMEVVGEAGTAEEALRRLPAVRPNVAILDLRLPDGSGVEVCREVRSRMPQTACVILTSFADEEALLTAVMAGAAGYLLKEIKTTTLVDDLRRVAAGGSLLDPVVTQRVIDRMRAGSEEDPGLSQLTAQERRVLDLIAEGKTNRQIADSLFLAEKTVKNYVTNILMKLGLERRTEAAVYATRVQERQARRPH